MHYPLLDIKDALRDADRNLADVARYVKTLQEESNGQYPPDGAQVLANVVAARELLGGVIPPALREAIYHEQAVYDQEEARWSA